MAGAGPASAVAGAVRDPDRDDAELVSQHGVAMNSYATGADLGVVQMLRHGAAQWEEAQDAAARARYTKAGVITLHWIKNYTELNFRSLGSYTRADLDAIAAAPEAF